LAGQARGTEFQPTDKLKYFEELKRGTNTDIGTKDLFAMASKKVLLKRQGLFQSSLPALADLIALALRNRKALHVRRVEL